MSGSQKLLKTILFENSAYCRQLIISRFDQVYEEEALWSKTSSGWGNNHELINVSRSHEYKDKFYLKWESNTKRSLTLKGTKFILNESN